MFLVLLVSSGAGMFVYDLVIESQVNKLTKIAVKVTKLISFPFFSEFLWLLRKPRNFLDLIFKASILWSDCILLEELGIAKLPNSQHFTYFCNGFTEVFTKMKFVFCSILETNTGMKIFALLGMCDPMHKLAGNICFIWSIFINHSLF